MFFQVRTLNSVGHAYVATEINTHAIKVDIKILSVLLSSVYKSNDEPHKFIEFAV